MIIPVRCFTCGKVLAGKWRKYVELCEEAETTTTGGSARGAAAELGGEDKPHFDKGHKAAVLDAIGVDKMCCRRHILTHVDLVDVL
jgi:DNA-directed RNA polymerase subunit N (RpoN/RPB10)